MISDKILHLIAGAIIAQASSALGYPDSAAIGNAVIIGTLKELTDIRKPGGYFDPLDLAATALGGTLIRIKF